MHRKVSYVQSISDQLNCRKRLRETGLYDPAFEHDSCGVGFVVNVNGEHSHQIVTDGITVLKNLAHRGAIGGDSRTGDGAGILVSIPHKFFQKECNKNSIALPQEGSYGVLMLFLSREENRQTQAKKLINSVILSEGGKILGYRDVPVFPECLGDMARQSMPYICQAIISFGSTSGNKLEHKLYIVRKCIERQARIHQFTIDDLYIPSCSSKTVVYKGMFVAPQLEEFYPDLNDPDFESCFSLVHQRYSTNTFPSWPLAQPFRYMAHNGEINTLRGNINKMTAREKNIHSKLFGDDTEKLLPVVEKNLSDSGIFDNVFELLCMGGRSAEHSMMMMVPETFGQRYHISEDKRSFFEFHAAIMEPWDGPAAIAFTDGIRIGATLDRNGLRPARYVITQNGKVVLASETGVLDIAPEDIQSKGRLAPGKMLIIDTEKKRVLFDNEIKASVSRQKPYRRWLEKNRIELKGLFGIPGPVDINDSNHHLRLLNVFGYTLEEISVVIKSMAENAQEPVLSMGNDAALAVLSDRPQLLYNYFKQLFAQVTNPPIDPYRENLVMSLMSFIGREKNLLDETPEHCHQIKLTHPVLSNDDIIKLRNIDTEGYRCCTLGLLFDISVGEKGLETALIELCKTAENKINEGYSLLILSDRGVDKTKAPIPALLATSTINHYLTKAKIRHLTGLIIETGEVRDVHHFATLIGYGASAVNPYMAFEILFDLKKKCKLDMRIETAVEHYITAVKKGLLKVMSKMGISTIRSYRGAQIFEAVGLNEQFINKYFPGTSSRIGGIGIQEIAHEVIERHSDAFAKNENELKVIDSGGNFHFRRNSEKHLYTAEAIALIHRAVREKNYSLYKEYAQHINNTSKNLCTLRGLFKFRKRESIPLEEIEPAESIVKRFVSSAMSFGSISKEAHETIAIAMNRLGAMSNSGEGGEDEERYNPLSNGDLKKSMIKQVASGRFGVTCNYLVNSAELQIKMAQGAKPGEGGQLAGLKVDETIARVRLSTPGVTLISPPPHHDIYSIEDLAQLIFDLKNANRDARVSVKLVAEAGVGTIAAGVAKGKADMVLISGHDGGTGNSPISSIKYAGIPWEIGLAETQQTLVLNNLRDRIRIQTDGQMRTGRDIVIASLLGAEEFGFGTASLVSLGCVMMRKCHLNTCPVGVATQDKKLRRKFCGKPEHLINFMMFVAQDVREIMAQLGFRNMDEMTGRVDILDVNSAIDHWKTKGLDFSRILTKPAVSPDTPLRCTGKQEHDFSMSIDNELIRKLIVSMDNKEKTTISMPIRNCNRTVGTALSSEISRRYGSNSLPHDSIRCKFKGSAGQSFGAFLAKGITFELEGDANDYLGKGLSGGKIIVFPDKKSHFRSHENIITGNVNLFGATGGSVFINGMAGERFAVRNSGATAVVEGVGDHGCEYMTGGVVVVLGRTGVNFAAGMSGGFVFVFDKDQLFDTKCNLEMVDIEPVTEKKDITLLKSLIKQHIKYTKSSHALYLLENWQETLPLFVKIMPIEYRSALARMKQFESKETEEITITEEVFR